MGEARKRFHTPRSFSGTVDTAEVARFDRLAAEWWNPHGKFRPLHRLNPIRLRYVRDRLAAHFRRNPLSRKPLARLRILDVGCGGGLLCEPLARLGAVVVGIDPAAHNISVARRHAEDSGLVIDYRVATAETLATAGETFDAVLALEVVEHVAEPSVLIDACCALLGSRARGGHPRGVTVLATLNRTARSYVLAILGAEYVLRWLPVGTHNWRRFCTPAELAAWLRRNGLAFADLSGVTYDPFIDEWRLTRDLSVNYMGFAVPVEESTGKGDGSRPSRGAV